MCVCVSVCLSVCLSVKSHLAFGASVRPEKAVTDSAGNVRRKFCGVFSETDSFQSYGTSCIYGYCEVGHIFTGNTRVSLPSYDPYR